jgi:hypothetical protein
MSKLTTKARNKLPASKFALPGGRYPVNDKSHAANAKARVTQQLAKGNISTEDAAKVRHKANVVLGETDSTHHTL